MEVIRPYFFKDLSGFAVTVTSERYLNTLSEYYFPITWQTETNIYYQQDGGHVRATQQERQWLL